MKPDWLAELAPEHAPAAPGWWPPAPGWWLLALILLIILVGAWNRWRNPSLRLRRRALKELAAIRARGSGSLETAQALQNLLRRYALALFGREAVAGLSGPAWLGFLAARGGDAFGGAIGQSMLKAAYGAGGEPGAGGESATLDARAGWFTEAEKFVRRAVPPKRPLPKPRPAKRLAPPERAP